MVYFSDLTDGVITGWEASATKGAAVTIWGNNFGDSRGTSYVTCGGQNLILDGSYGEWGATTNPTVARGMQRITFWLNSSMSVGATTISVTTADGTSNTIAFFTRELGSNYIYFISTPTGSNTNNGLRDTDEGGGVGPWLDCNKARSTLDTGDACYIRTGTYTFEYNHDGGDSYHGMFYFSAGGGVHNNGTANNSISVAAYPGEAVQLGGNYDSGETVGHIIKSITDDGSILSYWTFSKFIMRSMQRAAFISVNTNKGSNLRIIGNDMQTYWSEGGGYSATAVHGSADHFYWYGNYVHDLGVDYRGSGQSLLFHSYPLYVEGFGNPDYIYVGWNEMCYGVYSRGLQIYGHLATDTVDHIYVHDNYSHDNGCTGLLVGGGDPTTGPDYEFVGTAYIYNNIIDTNGYPTYHFEGMRIGGGGSGDHGGNYYIWNNTFYNNDGGELEITAEKTIVDIRNNIFFAGTDANDNRYYCGTASGTYTHASNNCYYNGTGDVPDTIGSYIITDPGITSPSAANFVLLSTSTCRDVGLSTTDITDIAPKDYIFIDRPQGDAIDIGAYEYFTGETGSISNKLLYNGIFYGGSF